MKPLPVSHLLHSKDHRIYRVCLTRVPHSDSVHTPNVPTSPPHNFHILHSSFLLAVVILLHSGLSMHRSSTPDVAFFVAFHSTQVTSLFPLLVFCYPFSPHSQSTLTHIEWAIKPTLKTLVLLTFPFLVLSLHFTPLFVFITFNNFFSTAPIFYVSIMKC